MGLKITGGGGGLDHFLHKKYFFGVYSKSEIMIDYIDFTSTIPFITLITVSGKRSRSSLQQFASEKTKGMLGQIYKFCN